MKIAIIIHNNKGQTKYIADKLSKSYKNSEVEIIELVPIENDSNQTVELEFYPNFEDYDKVFIGAPLIKGELSPVMEEFLLRLPHSENQVVTGFITQFSLSSSKKGLIARDRMIELCVSKNIKVLEVENIKWLNPFLGADI